MPQSIQYIVGGRARVTQHNNMGEEYTYLYWTWEGALTKYTIMYKFQHKMAF